MNSGTQESGFKESEPSFKERVRQAAGEANPTDVSQKDRGVTQSDHSVIDLSEDGSVVEK